MFLTKRVNDSEGPFGSLKALNERALCSPHPPHSCLSRHCYFYLRILQLHFRESQAETEAQPCSQDGKEVTDSKVVKKREHQKGREALREEFETLFGDQNCHNGQVGSEATLRNAKPWCSTQFSSLGCKRKHSQAWQKTKQGFRVPGLRKLGVLPTGVR